MESLENLDNQFAVRQLGQSRPVMQLLGQGEVVQGGRSSIWRMSGCEGDWRGGAGVHCKDGGSIGTFLRGWWWQQGRGVQAGLDALQLPFYVVQP